MIKDIEICNHNRFTIMAKELGYNIFPLREGKPYNINIWGVRSSNQKAGKFDDLLCVFYYDENNELVFNKYKVTVDPSDLSLMNMKNKLGVAIIKPGQYNGSHILGFHKGQYEALVQKKPITVIRDFNRDAILDTQLNSYFNSHTFSKNGVVYTEYYDDENKLIFRDTTGIFGINIHRASAYHILESVGLYSEGCIVFQNPKEYIEFIDICKRGAKYYGNSYTLTVITEQQIYNSIYNRRSLPINKNSKYKHI